MKADGKEIKTKYFAEAYQMYDFLAEINSIKWLATLLLLLMDIA